jgi:hypothetical protein
LLFLAWHTGRRSAVARTLWQSGDWGINRLRHGDRAPAQPKGDRVKIALCGKFLPYKCYGIEQGILEYGINET